MTQLHIGTLSSGVSSAYVCKLMIDEVGPDNAELVFTDTMWEDEDNYRFLDEIVAALGVRFTRLSAGKNPMELAWTENALPSNRIPFCSRRLKHDPLRDYLKGRENVTLWWGIGIEEKHRRGPIESNWLKRGVASRFPLIEQLTTYAEPFEWLESIGITPPRMYKLGFTHANCGGRCVRGGLSHWSHLYATWPERYKEVEGMEQRWQRDYDKPNTILKKSVGGEQQPISLKDFRQQFLEGAALFGGLADDSDTDGACACMSVYGSDD